MDSSVTVQFVVDVEEQGSNEWVTDSGYSFSYYFMPYPSGTSFTLPLMTFVLGLLFSLVLFFVLYRMGRLAITKPNEIQNYDLVEQHD